MYRRTIMPLLRRRITATHSLFPKNVTEATVTDWSKVVGDFVKEGDFLCRLSYNNNNTPIPSKNVVDLRHTTDEGGYIGVLHVPNGATIGVGQTVVELVDDLDEITTLRVAKALHQTPNNSQLWVELGDALTAWPATVKSVEYSKSDCYLQAIKLEPASPIAWAKLGACLYTSFDGDAKVDVNGENHPVTGIDCCAKALELDPKCTEAWSTLAYKLRGGRTAQVNGKEQTEQDCLLEAVESNLEDSKAWCDLGGSLIGRDILYVHSNYYNKQQCYVEALKRDAGNVRAWRLLARLQTSHSTIEVKGKHYTALDCYLEIAKRDDTAWYNVGRALISNQKDGGNNECATVVVDGKKYTVRDCYLKALESMAADGYAWNGLGELLPNNESVFVKGYRCNSDFTKQECFKEATKWSPEHAAAWVNLASTLDDTLDGRNAKIQCYIKGLESYDEYSLECPGNDAILWEKLGDVLDEVATATVNGVEYSKVDCFSKAKALQLKPTS